MRHNTTREQRVDIDCNVSIQSSTALRLNFMHSCHEHAMKLGIRCDVSMAIDSHHKTTSRRCAMKSCGQVHTGWMKSQPMSHTFSLVLQATALLLSQMAATDSANYILNQNSTTRFIYEQASKVRRPRFKKSSFWGPVNGIYCIGSGTRLHLSQNRKYERLYIKLSCVL